MTETIEQACQRILDARGYLIIASLWPEKIGAIVPGFAMTENFDELTAKLAVIADTDLHDAAIQCQMMFGKPLDHVDPYYYRVLAE